MVVKTELVDRDSENSEGRWKDIKVTIFSNYLNNPIHVIDCVKSYDLVGCHAHAAKTALGYANIQCLKLFGIEHHDDYILWSTEPFIYRWSR